MTQQTDSQTNLSIVLPCYNPPKHWEKIVVESVLELEQRISQSIELIVVNDGSTQNITSEHLSYIDEKLNTFTPIEYSENRGKGYALRQGVKVCKTDLIIYTDIDFPYTLGSVEAMFLELQKGTDVVLGHRGQDYYKKTPWFRKVISKTLRWFLKTFLRLPTDDSQCGIKGYNQRGKQAFLDTNIDRFLFDLEFIKLASRRKMNSKTVTVTLKPNVIFSKVNLKILATEGLNFLKVLFRK
jgi:glycosyltransferase involved in cell wall biosynthesis